MTAQTRIAAAPARSLLALAPRWIALGLVLLALLTRIPLRTQFLYHWDSVNYALALEEFNVFAHHPHPPGYLLYVGLGKLVQFFVTDANAAYVWISVVSSAAAVVLVYRLASEMYDARVGLWAGLFVLTSPLLWFYGEVALPYLLDLAIALLIVWTCYRVREGQTSVLWASALLMGLVGGVRPQTTIILFPLWLYAVSKQGVVRVVVGLVVMGLAALVWFLPLAYLSGGIPAYWSLLSSYSASLSGLSPLGSPASFLGNLVRSFGYIMYGFPLGVVILMYAGLAQIRARKGWVPDRRERLMLLWLIPAIGFYLLVHLQQPGHLAIAMPPLAILLARASVNQGAKAERILGGAIVAAGVLFFLLAPARLLPRPEGVFMTPTWDSLRARETFLIESIKTLRTEFDPESTALLGVSQVYHQPDFYLRSYKRYTEELARVKARIVLPVQYRRLVLYGNSNEGDWQPPGNAESVSIGNSRLYFYAARDGEQIFLEPGGVGVIPAPAP